VRRDDATSGSSRGSYTFGDSAVAGDRLALLASVFETSSTALLESAGPSATAAAVDLGCGPGFTTALVARVTGARRTVGLDASEAFVARARATHDDPSIEFAVHDVAHTPLPDPPADLIHARFLLAHLPDPQYRLASWSSQLARGGRLVCDETERIDTDLAPFMRYERLGRAMVAQRGADLQVGRTLRDADPPAGTRLVHSACTEIRPSTATVAAIYGMNFATWRHEPFVVDTVPALELDALADALAELQGSTGEGELVFCNRQVVYERS
jgi:SAM-dependent methyltransferase